MLCTDNYDMAEIATGQTHWQDSHLLVELHTTDSLLKPIHGSTRIQYTSIAVSEEFIALGSSTGAVYIFSHPDLKYISIIHGVTVSQLYIYT
ncbi:hypothetical protein LSH36_737g05052 [Paralvinella palmiformis]|uniref:Uncharacterized protein n=1 Tax=Paralvinella palmiformis TaxID=53620 RepID=A0AAD9J169_9ANNE|nr:hypothetical protein LSH36_737g05052 [Paralvinella palmiformis]